MRLLSALFAIACAAVALATPLASNTTLTGRNVQAIPPPNCFPAIGFRMPSSVPSSLSNWWCDYSTEYAFVGISYEITQCQPVDRLRREFSDLRTRWNSRYVRLYGFCDEPGYYDKVIDAAWSAGVGVHALIWFGWDGGTQWKGRRDSLFNTLQSNQRAKFVTRVVQFGSEPLYDWAIHSQDLAREVWDAKAKLANLQIPVTVSEMAYGYQVREGDGSINVLNAVDFVDAHMLPYFSHQASTAWNAWPIVMGDLSWFLNNSGGKKIYLSQPNSPNAVANVQNEQYQDYYDLLDSHCVDFKNMKGGGVGWFAHIYSDYQEPGYGIYKSDGTLKIRFNPRTSC
ncbi:B-(1-6) glucan synthase [Coprinopsis marcescibilis]|uniref:glucan endo-1,3-beta-D-glucosidase n=1 Tax=Coprinopsis marcescibilis TaxID=230819 RepID=A0A5C3L563_COPMA|nr:B-(1-6) glucan synthase [Coprinopsis marcescibilis]